MNCEDIRELLPAYVLGALEHEEHDMVEDHLRLGREHDQELAELRATVFAMDRFLRKEHSSVALAEPGSRFTTRNKNPSPILGKAGGAFSPRQWQLWRLSLCSSSSSALAG